MCCPLSIRGCCVAILLTVLLHTVTSANELASTFGEIELVRDGWGVPHVFAETDAGAMYGLGYAAAQDRGFQMHYFLRIIQGRMSEFMGIVDKRKTGSVGPNNTLEHDRLMRAFGFARAAARVAENLPPATRELLLAYSAGVNDYFSSVGDDEHYLFNKTSLVREPWTPADCLLSWWHFAQFFAKNGLRDYPHLTARQMPPERRGRIVIDDDAAVVRQEDVSAEWIEQVNNWLAETGLTPEPASGPDTPDPKFSHAWVIGGKRTTTGSAVLVSDPQTPVWNPSMLYEFHAQGKTFNARGVGVAGSPIILIGFNEQVAWGVTALGADQADLFVLKTDPDRPNQYEVDGEWLEMTCQDEVVTIAGSEPETLSIRNTIFGPIVSEHVWQNPKGQQLALCRVPMAETDRDTIDGALGMMRARSCAEFAAALPQWRFPTANCVFGDRQGDIGYWSLGALPVRSTLTGSDGGHAQDGSTRRGMWQGMIPYEMLPHCINPRRGYLVTANHRTIQSFYRVPFGNMTGSAGDTDRGLRIKERIAEHLAEREQFEPADVLAIHYDCVNVWKREVVRLGFAVLETEPQKLSPDSRKALEHLRDWYAQGARTDLSVPGTELVNQIQVIFRGGTNGLVGKYGGGVSGLARFAKDVRRRDAELTRAQVSADELAFVDGALAGAWQQAERMLGADPKRWNDLANEALCRQKMGYMEGLDGFPSLDPRFDTRMPRLTTVDGATVLSQRAQSYTQFVTLHEPDESLSILPFGSSDDPHSPFRFSTYRDWSRGVLHPAPLSRSAVAKLAVTQEVLGRTEPVRSIRSGAPSRDRSAAPQRGRTAPPANPRSRGQR